jgi:large repetitive protein
MAPTGLVHGGPHPLRSLRGAAIALVAAIVLISVAPAHADRAFAPRFSANQPGDITIVANSVLTCPDPPSAACTTARNGGAGNDNDFSMTNIDVDSDPSTPNSSRATLAMPAGAKVLWAGLYWFAFSSNSARNTVKFQGPGQSSYTGITATTLDTTSTSYQGFADVTSIVSAAGNGVYTAADVKANTGFGQAGGWALIVVYNDPTQPPRNLSVFDGLTLVPPSPNTITVNGFTTPPSGGVKTSLGAVVLEGDRSLTPDAMTLNGTTMSNPANPANNNFNSSITTLGADIGGRTPNYGNVLGVDADLFKADGILGNNATSATIKLTTSNDAFAPGVVTFSTELYAPVVVPDKTVTNLTHPGGPTQPGDTLRYALNFQNTGQDAADGFVVTDPIPAGTTYMPGSLSIGGSGAQTDAAGDDQAEFDGGQGRIRFRLGSGANATSGGSLAENGGSASATFEVTVDAGHSEGDVITNRASSDYRGHTIGTPFVNQLTPAANTTVHVPDLTLSKQHNPSFLAGGNTTFTLVASNVSTASTDGTPVTVTDTFPSGIAGFDSISNAGGPGWNCNIASLTLTCIRTDVLAGGQSYPPILVDAHLHDPLAPTVINQASVSGGGDESPVNNQATDSGGATAQADLQVTKRTTTPSVASGGQIQWVVDVHNAGPSTAAGVTMSDPSLGGSDYDQVVATPTQGTCDTTVSCDLGSIVPGGTASVTIDARVLANDTTLNNGASATTSTADPDNTNNNATASAIVDNTADVRIEKAGGPSQPSIGDTYTYTIDVSNDGPGDATDLVVSDQLPAKLGGTINVSAGDWSCNSPGPGGLLTCTLASLADGDSSPIEVSGQVQGPQGGYFQNDAAVTTSSTDPNPGNNTATKNELATPAADLAVTKTFDSDSGTAGIQTGAVDPSDTIAVILTLTNNGPSTSQNAMLDDSVPAGFNVTGVDDPDCTATGNDVHCEFGDLADGDSRTVTITATVNTPADPVQGDTITNTATSSSDTLDQIQSNDSDRDDLTVTPAADLSLTKIADDTNPSVGDSVTYTLVARNAGPSTAVGVSVSDELPAGVSFVSASTGCGESGGTVTCTPTGGNLASGGSATFTITVAVNASGAGSSIGNTASVDSTSPHDPDPSNNTAGTNINVQPQADLELTKSAADPAPAVDADDTFTLTVTNHGSGDAENVTIDDPVPAGLTFVSASPECQLQDTTVHCALGTLAADDIATVTVTLRPGPSAHGQALSNLATVSSTTDDPTPANNSDSADITVGERVDLHLAKTVSPPSVPAGENATYTLTVTNSGPSDATGVTVTDPLLPGISFVDANPSQGTCAESAGTVTCDLGTIASGGQAQVELTVRAETAAAGETLTNTASVTANEPEARSGDNSAATNLGVTPPPVPGPGPGPNPNKIKKCFFGHQVTILGTQGPDQIVGTPGVDVINGRGGNDVILGMEGNDLICGGAGNDLIKGGLGNDRVKGSTGNDRIRGNEGSDWLRGAPGDDRVSGRQGNDRLMGNRGDDRLRGNAGRDVLLGGPGKDVANGGPGLDRALGVDRMFRIEQ